MDLIVDPNLFSFSNTNPNPTHLPKQQTLSPNHQFYQRFWYVECYSVHAHTVWIRNYANQKFGLKPAPVKIQNFTPAFVQSSDSGAFSGKNPRLRRESTPSPWSPLSWNTLSYSLQTWSSFSSSSISIVHYTFLLWSDMFILLETLIMYYVVRYVFCILFKWIPILVAYHYCVCDVDHESVIKYFVIIIYFLLLHKMLTVGFNLKCMRCNMVSKIIVDIWRINLFQFNLLTICWFEDDRRLIKKCELRNGALAYEKLCFRLE